MTPGRREAAARLLADGWTGPTVVTAADVVAIGVLAHLSHEGRSVPDEFRVAGLDGIGAAAPSTRPDHRA